MDKIIEHLAKVGFTNNESRVYIALLELGESKTGRLCDKTDIPNSHIYEILESLIKKGVISYKLANNTKIYSPNKPESLKAIISKKKDELEVIEGEVKEIVDILKKIPKNEETVSNYRYFEGISGIKSLWFEFTESLVPKTEVLVYTGTREGFKELNKFYLEHHRERVKKGVKERMILPLGSGKEGLERKRIGKIDIKYLENKKDMEFIVYQDTIIIQYTNESVKPRAFMIKDPIFAGGFKELFEKLWSQAKDKA